MTPPVGPPAQAPGHETGHAPGEVLFAPALSGRGAPRRVLAVVFPELAIELHARRAGRADAEDGPFALYERAHNALCVAHANAPARAAGLYPAQPLAEARALVPALRADAHDAVADAADFGGIAYGFLRYGPHVGAPGIGRVCVEIAGSAHLFGGEAGVLADLEARLAATRLSARAVVADTPAAALAVAGYETLPDVGAGWAPIAGARGGRNPGWRGEPIRTQLITAAGAAPAFLARIVKPGGDADAIAPLPVEALGLDPAVARSLRTLGLKTVGAVRGQPRAGLARRFGKALVDRLDAASGALFESLSPIAERPDFSVLAKFPSPVMSVEAALEATRGLAERLARRLERDDQGARRFVLHLFRLDGSHLAEAVDLAAPSRDPGAILRLFRLKFEKGDRPVDPGFGFDAFRLVAMRLASMPARQRATLSDGADAVQDRRRALARLADRLTAALGSGAVAVARSHDAHAPERAVEMVQAMAGRRAGAAAWPAAAASDGAPWRPLFLAPVPEPVEAMALAPDGPPARFVWRRVPYRVVRAAGPERILGEWRLGETRLRDYYRVEDDAGRRFWIFREGMLGEAGTVWRLAGAFA